MLLSAPRKLQKNIVAAYTAETYSCNTCQYRSRRSRLRSSAALLAAPAETDAKARRCSWPGGTDEPRGARGGGRVRRRADRNTRLHGHHSHHPRRSGRIRWRHTDGSGRCGPQSKRYAIPNHPWRTRSQGHPAQGQGATCTAVGTTGRPHGRSLCYGARPRRSAMCLRWPSLVICLGDFTKGPLFVLQGDSELHWVAPDAPQAPFEPLSCK